MNPIPFVDLAAQRAALGDELTGAIDAALERGDYILGEDVARFEEEFAAFTGVEHAIGVDSGTSALELILRALDVGPGDEVALPANTFVATALAVTSVGARPVLVDVDDATALMDPEALREAMTPATRAVIAVHLYGQVADMEAIGRIAADHGAALVEDACQAHGATQHGRRAGTFGAAAAFSFYPAKNLGGFGDGGAVVTGSSEIAERVQLLRNYGQREKYRSDVPGFNRRLDTVQAAALRVKLRHLDSWNERRREHAARYALALSGAEVELPVVAAANESVWHLYVVRVRDRGAVQAGLGERGVGTGIHYPIPVHLQPAFADLGHRVGDFPVAERQAHEILSLPMYAELPEDAPQRVAESLREVQGECETLRASGRG